MDGPRRASSDRASWQSNDWNDGGIGGGMERPRHMDADHSRFSRGGWETDQGRASYGYDPSRNVGVPQYGQESSSGRRSYAGRGPKGYQRSDERIREDVSDSLTDDHYVDASEITVEVREREVTLSGTVETREQKYAAEACAEDVSGVREVINQLRVTRGQAGQGS